MASIHHLPPATATSDLVVFGTYRLKGEVLEIALGQAIHAMTQHGIPSPLIDTALSYNNTEIIESVLRKYPNIRIGSKVHRRNEVAADLEGEMAKYGSRLHRVLLHRYMPVESYLHLVKAKAEKKLVEIGVSNYSVAQLRELVAALQELDKQGLLPLPFRDAVPDVCQNEFHAFLKTSVPEACRDLGIRFEAHSIFSKLDEYPQDLRNPEARPTAGQIAMAYAVQRSHGGTVAFNTANYRHLIENLGLETVDEAVFAHLEAHVRDNSLAFAKYAGSDTAAFRPQLNCSEPAIGSGFDTLAVDYIMNTLAPKLKIDLDLVNAGKVPASSTANGIPKLIVKNPQRRAAYLALANALVDPLATRPGKAAAAAVGSADDDEAQPSPQAVAIAEAAKMQKLEAGLSKVRRALFEHALAMRKKAKPIMCRYRAVEDPEALPVDIPDPAVLQPFIDLIAETTALPETAIRMERGVLFPDGRMDFCKQVAQPSFEKLCAAVLKGGVVKHFLIGNNLALANDTTGSREAALASLIRDSKGIQTWYLAGNAISKDQIASIADAIASSADAKYVWLKMNPIQTGSYHLGRMLKRNPRIEVLDLFNTGQCDAGVAALLQGYDDASAEASPDSAPSGLKHLYLDINAITDGALVARLASRFPQLETLSVNVNQLRDAGVKALCDGLTAPMLQRLVLGSNGAKNESIDAIEDVVRRHPHLTILQLGSYKSTRFFRHQANSFTSYDRMLKLAATVAANARASSNPAMNYFGFQHCYWQSDASQLVLAVADLGLHANGVQWNSGGQTTITSKQLNELLGTPTNVQPAPVEYIQSVYRNNM